MALTDATLNSMGTHLAGLITHIALHTADPSTTGANPAASARVAVSWTVDADGDLTLTSSPLAFTGGASGGACTHWGGWSAISGGTFRGGGALTGDQTFNVAGEYNITAITIPGTST